jgi:hypothetical protein
MFVFPSTTWHARVVTERDCEEKVEPNTVLALVKTVVLANQD